jgi:hypothetical protein
MTVTSIEFRSCYTCACVRSACHVTEQLNSYASCTIFRSRIFIIYLYNFLVRILAELKAAASRGHIYLHLLRSFQQLPGTKLLGLSPRANYTDRATAAYRRSNCQILRIEGCHVVSVTDPYGRILDFLDRSRYFSIK